MAWSIRGRRESEEIVIGSMLQRIIHESRKRLTVADGRTGGRANQTLSIGAFSESHRRRMRNRPRKGGLGIALLFFLFMCTFRRAQTQSTGCVDVTSTPTGRSMCAMWCQGVVVHLLRSIERSHQQTLSPIFIDSQAWRCRRPSGCALRRGGLHPPRHLLQIGGGCCLRR